MIIRNSKGELVSIKHGVWNKIYNIKSNKSFFEQLIKYIFKK